MRGDLVLAQPVGQLPRQPLGHLPRVDEHERGAMLANQRRDAVVVLRPHFMRHHRFERRRGQLDAEIDVAAMTLINHRAIGHIVLDCGGPHQESRDGLDGTLRGRQPDAEGRPVRNRGKTLEREGEVRAAARADHRVDLVDDHRADVREPLAAPLRRQQQVQRLRGRHENVRRRPHHRRARRRGRVSGAHRRGDHRSREAHFGGQRANARQGLSEVLVDVAAQSFERRDVEDSGLLGQAVLDAFAQQIIDGDQECREGLARSGRRRNQRVAPFADRGPSGRLGGRRRSKRGREPAVQLRDEMRTRKHCTEPKAGAKAPALQTR